MFVLIILVFDLAFFVFFFQCYLRSTVGYLGHKQKFAFSFKQFFSEQQTAVAYHKFIRHSVLMSYVWLGSYMQVIESYQVIRE